MRRMLPMLSACSLATWTTYKSYREQLAQNNSVQLERNNVSYFEP